MFLEAPIGEDPDKRYYIVSNEKIERTGWKPDLSLDPASPSSSAAYRMLRNCATRTSEFTHDHRSHPLACSFFGGGNRPPSWFETSEPSAVLSTTINKYVYVQLRRLRRFSISTTGLPGHSRGGQDAGGDPSSGRPRGAETLRPRRGYRIRGHL